jgi:hypothetical protein
MLAPWSITIFYFPYCSKDTRAGYTPFGSTHCTVVGPGKRTHVLHRSKLRTSNKKDTLWRCSKTLHFQNQNSFTIANVRGSLTSADNPPIIRTSHHACTHWPRPPPSDPTPMSKVGDTKRRTTQHPCLASFEKATVPKRPSVLRVKQPTKSRAPPPVSR